MATHWLVGSFTGTGGPPYQNGAAGPVRHTAPPSGPAPGPHAYDTPASGAESPCPPLRACHVIGARLHLSPASIRVTGWTAPFRRRFRGGEGS